MTMKSAIRYKDFEGMLLTQRGRKTMITEGDSWFGYPASHAPVRHSGTNIIDHIEDENRFNIFRMESSGDEAGTIMSQTQRHKLHDVLSKLREKKFPPDYILFSAGGNDIVGEHDMIHFLNKWENGMSAKQCIREKRFSLRLAQIRLAYEELILFRDEYCEKAYIITHGYDYAIPSNVKAKFLFGMVKVQPWIKPYMDQKNIPKGEMQKEVIHMMIERLNTMLDEVCKSTARMVKVETAGTLQAGDWRDEIHANEAGFKKIADKFLKVIDKIENQ